MKRPDPVKRRMWTERFEKFDSSHQTIAEFCATEGVSVPSFYQWRKKLSRAAVDRVKSVPTGRSPNGHMPRSFLPVHVASSVSEKPAGGVTVRMANGIEIALGSDLSVIQAVLNQLLDRHPGSNRSTP